MKIKNLHVKTLSKIFTATSISVLMTLGTVKAAPQNETISKQSQVAFSNFFSSQYDILGEYEFDSGSNYFLAETIRLSVDSTGQNVLISSGLPAISLTNNGENHFVGTLNGESLHVTNDPIYGVIVDVGDNGAWHRSVFQLNGFGFSKASVDEVISSKLIYAIDTLDTPDKRFYSIRLIDGSKHRVSENVARYLINIYPKIRQTIN